MGKKSDATRASAKASNKASSKSAKGSSSSKASSHAVAAAAAVPPPPRTKTGVHAFESAAFLLPDVCGICNGMLWGFWNQGFSCGECGFNAHLECVPKVPMTCCISPDEQLAPSDDTEPIDRILEFPNGSAGSGAAAQRSSSDSDDAPRARKSKKNGAGASYEKKLANAKALARAEKQRINAASKACQSCGAQHAKAVRKNGELIGRFCTPCVYKLQEEEQAKQRAAAAAATKKHTKQKKSEKKATTAKAPLCAYCREEPATTEVRSKSGSVYGVACAVCLRAVKAKKIAREPPVVPESSDEDDEASSVLSGSGDSLDNDDDDAAADDLSEASSSSSSSSSSSDAASANAAAPLDDRQVNDAANEAFAAQDFARAIQLYSQAISMKPDEAVYFSNRSVCTFRVGAYEESLADAEHCIALCEARGVADRWDKPFYRKAKALMALDRLDEAHAFLQRTAQMFPSSVAIQSLLEEVNAAVGYSEDEDDESSGSLHTSDSGDLDAAADDDDDELSSDDIDDDADSSGDYSDAVVVSDESSIELSSSGNLSSSIEV